MKRMFVAAALSFALTISVTTPAAESVPANAPMPVLYQVEKNGPTFPVYAQKDGAYYPVFVYVGGQPYFTDADGKFHFVASDTAENFPVFYVNGQSSAPIALPHGKTDEQAKDILLSGNSEAKDTLVHWGCRGWFGYRYSHFRNYCYYPRYYYGGYYGGSYYGGAYYGGAYSNGGYYGGGYYNGGYYGGGYYNGGYYGGGYYGGYYNSGYYGFRSYGNPNYYNGYGCVLNNFATPYYY